MNDIFVEISCLFVLFCFCPPSQCYQTYGLTKSVDYTFISRFLLKLGSQCVFCKCTKSHPLASCRMYRIFFFPTISTPTKQDIMEGSRLENGGEVFTSRRKGARRCKQRSGFPNDFFSVLYTYKVESSLTSSDLSKQRVSNRCQPTGRARDREQRRRLFRGLGTLCLCLSPFP